ncbi:MAG: MoxR family ATPase [Acidobacteriota bacterium]|jgi:MoxR-like ATPase|nr:MoxR family ATPase [Acidobacteriota bacterium]
MATEGTPGQAEPAHPAAGGLPIFTRLMDNIEKVILGKREVIETILSALLARGYVLVEDLPGVGKTILARALALSIQGQYRRVQCTPDLLPSDVTGVSIWDPKEMQFKFRPGPIFTNVLLVDEVNRATPRTQAAFLEAMEERQVSVDGHPYAIPKPFFLIATQNPIEMAGTFPLPEAQLDRFMMRIAIGYPASTDEVNMMRAQRELHPIRFLKPVMDAEHLMKTQDAVRKIFIHDSVLSYIQRIVDETRRHPHAAFGSSPRGALHLLHASQALAAIRRKSFVTPDHVKTLAEPVLAHRVLVKPHSRVQGVDGKRVVEEVLRTVEVPVDFEPR